MFTQDVKGGERLDQALKMLDELNIDPSMALDPMWKEVQDRAETIYRVVRKDARKAQTMRKNQAKETMFNDF
jgi:hypothetical protein